MTSADPTGLHDWHSDAYVQEWIGAQSDDERRLLLQRLVDLIPFDPDGELSVLDVGGGYGALSRVVLDTFPHARVVLHDYSEPMLDEARGRLGSYSDAVSYFRGDLMTSAWTQDLKGPFQAVVSSIAIHNVRYPERIKAVYSEIAPLVAPGGCFLNFDQVTAPGRRVAGAERHAGMMARRRQAQKETGEWPSLASIEAEVAARQAARRRDGGSGRDREIESDEPATIVNQVRWLREGGFDEAECFWRDGRRVIVGGFKAAQA